MAITAQFFDDNNNIWGDSFEIRVNEDPIEYITRFDEGFDTVSFETTKTLLESYDLPIKAFTKIKIVFNDGTIYYGIVTRYRDDIATYGDNESELLVSVETTELVEICRHIPVQPFNNSNIVLDSGQVITKQIKDIVERLDKLIWIRRSDDDTQQPLRITFNPNDWWTGVTSPELFFKDATLLEILIGIGEVVGGRPRLTFVSNGIYELTFNQWNNKDTTHHYDNSFSHRQRNSTTDGTANYLVSDAKNMISSTLGSESQMEFPGKAYPNLDTYARQIARCTTTDEFLGIIGVGDGPKRVIHLPFGIAKIIKLEVGFTDYTVNGKVYMKDVTEDIVHYERWKTLPTYDLVETFIGLRGTNTTLYYKPNEPYIYNIYNARNYLRMKVTESTVLPLVAFAGLMLVRVNYIPYVNAMVKVNRGDNIKPVGSWVNQGDQVISSTAYSNYMQGLVNRMQGEFTSYSFIKPKNAILYRAGEWLNDELIVEAQHEIGTQNIVSNYTCVPEFNRRSQFKAYPHQIRDWAIPENEIERTIHYSENIECSIGTALEESNGSLNESGLDLCAKYNRETEYKPTYAYIAWKDDEEIEEDGDKTSKDYALATLLATNFGTSVIWTWSCWDNASVGERGYASNQVAPIINLESVREQFVAYNSTAEKLQFKITQAPPAYYQFDKDETGTSGEDNNHNFYFTYPASMKKQYVDCSELALFKFDIYKDLRDKIISTTQFDFIGKNGTITYNGCSRKSPLCNGEMTTLKVYVGGSKEYSPNSITAQGQEITVNSVASSVVNGNAVINISLAEQLPVNTKIAITDGDGELLWATNSGLSSATSTLKIYLSNRKKQYRVL